VLGLDSAEAVTLPPEIEALAEGRRLARLAKEWQKAMNAPGIKRPRLGSAADTKADRKLSDVPPLSLDRTSPPASS